MKFKNWIIGLVTLGVSTLSVLAQIGQVQFSTGGIAYDAKTNYVIIGNKSVTGGQPVVTYLSAKSDQTASAVQFYQDTNRWTAASGLTNVTITNYISAIGGTSGVGTTNGLGPNVLLVVVHESLNPVTYEMLEVASIVTNPYSAQTNTSPTGIQTNFIYAVNVGVAPLWPVVPGDMIYLESTNNIGNIQVGVGSTNIGPGGMYSGVRGKPLLGVLKGGTNCSIQAVSATYTNP